MKLNDRMRPLYANLLEHERGGSVQLDNKLEALLTPGFCVVGDLTFLSSQLPISHVREGDFPDFTGYECFVNHIHIEDYLEGPLDELNMLKQGVAFVLRLEAALRTFSRGEHFQVILSSDGFNCVVRFHKLREGEFWLAPDIEAYDEALFVLEW